MSDPTPRLRPNQWRAVINVLLSVILIAGAAWWFGRPVGCADPDLGLALASSIEAQRPGARLAGLAEPLAGSGVDELCAVTLDSPGGPRAALVAVDLGRRRPPSLLVLAGPWTQARRAAATAEARRRNDIALWGQLAEIAAAVEAAED